MQAFAQIPGVPQSGKPFIIVKPKGDEKQVSKSEPDIPPFIGMTFLVVFFIGVLIYIIKGGK